MSVRRVFYGITAMKSAKMSTNVCLEFTPVTRETRSVKTLTVRFNVKARISVSKNIVFTYLSLEI